MFRRSVPINERPVRSPDPWTIVFLVIGIVAAVVVILVILANVYVATAVPFSPAIQVSP